MTEKKFMELFNGISHLLKNFAYSLTKNSEEAKDLFQETAFRSISNREKFREGTNFKAWTFTIMKNIFINKYRKKVKQNTILDSTDNNYYINSGSQVVDNGGVSMVTMKELQSMIDDIDDSLSVPFMMYFEGYKYHEIAEKLELPLGTVKSRIFFARRAMRDRYERAYGARA